MQMWLRGRRNCMVMILSSLTIFTSHFVHQRTHFGWRLPGKLRNEVLRQVLLLVLG